LGSPVGLRDSLCENQGLGLMEGALGSPRGFRRCSSEEPFEEEWAEPCSEKVGVGAEKGRVVPVEVAGDLVGNEVLGVEGWGGCGAR